MPNWDLALERLQGACAAIELKAELGVLEIRRQKKLVRVKSG